MQDDIMPIAPSREKASIANIHIEPELDAGYASAWIYVEVENHTREDLQVVVTVMAKIDEAQEKIDVTDVISPYGGVLETVIRIEEPELWWPAGFGAQTLYTCMVGLAVEGEVQDVGQQRFGLRKVEYVPGEEKGILLVNGEDIEVSQELWAPPDHFEPKAGAERQIKLVEQAHDAGALLVRAWGEGTERDSPFYDACDEAGLLVWQVLAPGASGCAEGKFAERAVDELEERVKRLRNHPSIVAWCGSDVECPDGNRLLEETLPGLIKRLDRTRTYLPHCPLI